MHLCEVTGGNRMHRGEKGGRRKNGLSKGKKLRRLKHRGRGKGK